MRQGVLGRGIGVVLLTDGLCGFLVGEGLFRQGVVAKCACDDRKQEGDDCPDGGAPRDLARVGEPSRLLLLALAPPLLGLGARRFLARAAAGEIGAVGRVEPGGDVGTGVERLRLGEALALMREPGVAARVGVPVARRALDALQRRQQAEILFQPAVEQAPLPQQRLVRRLDRRFASLLAGLRVARDTRVGRKQPLLDQKIDQRRRLRRNVGAAGDVAARRPAVGVDAGEPRDQPAAQQREARLAVAGNARIGVGARKRALDRGVDRALEAAELFVVGEPQRAGLAIVEIELLEREGEQRQRVARARLDVLEQPLRQRRLDRELAARLLAAAAPGPRSRR